jgi:hypothetical protein
MSASAVGKYRISYKGYNTPPQGHGLGTDGVKAVLEALPLMRDADGNPITVSVSNAFSSGDVIIVYNSDGYLSSDDKIEFTNLHGDDTNYTSTRPIQGKEGWIASATNQYDITVYAMMFRNVLSKQGRLAITDE